MIYAPSPAERGFTATDLARLEAVRAAALAQGRWSRALIVQDPRVDYLSAWRPPDAPNGAPGVAVARFKRTGTYALIMGETVVATAAELDRVLAVLWDRRHNGEAEDVGATP